MWLKQLKNTWAKACGIVVLVCAFLISAFPNLKLEAAPIIPVSTMVADVSGAASTTQQDETLMPTGPTIMGTVPTIMPTEPTIMMPTLSPEFFEEIQERKKENKN